MKTLAALRTIGLSLLAVVLVILCVIGLCATALYVRGEVRAPAVYDLVSGELMSRDMTVGDVVGPVEIDGLDTPSWEVAWTWESGGPREQVFASLEAAQAFRDVLVKFHTKGGEIVTWR